MQSIPTNVLPRDPQAAVVATPTQKLESAIAGAHDGFTSSRTLINSLTSAGAAANAGVLVGVLLARR